MEEVFFFYGNWTVTVEHRFLNAYKSNDYFEKRKLTIDFIFLVAKQKFYLSTQMKYSGALDTCIRYKRNLWIYFSHWTVEMTNEWWDFLYAVIWACKQFTDCTHWTNCMVIYTRKMNSNFSLFVASFSVTRIFFFFSAHALIDWRNPFKPHFGCCWRYRRVAQKARTSLIDFREGVAWNRSECIFFSMHEHFFSAKQQ